MAQATNANSRHAQPAWGTRAESIAGDPAGVMHALGEPRLSHITPFGGGATPWIKLHEWKASPRLETSCCYFPEAGFFSSAFFFFSASSRAVHGGTMLFERAYAISWPRCSCECDASAIMPARFVIFWPKKSICVSSSESGVP